MDYWEWQDQELAHPEHRAKGGEPCVFCGNPIPPNAHWKHRDRHACSSRCNTALRRRLYRKRVKGEAVPPPPKTDPFADRPPLVFGTDTAAPLAYGFLGLSPRSGDVVIRHGSVVIYGLIEVDPSVPEAVRRSIACHHVQSGSRLFAAVDENGTLGMGVLGVADHDGAQIGFAQPFASDGHEWIWTAEHIRDIDTDGNPYTWKAFICLPHPTPEDWDSTIWTPAYQQRSDELRRISSRTGQSARRLRLYGTDGTIERIDPIAVFERDHWVCQLCGEQIDPALGWPEPDSASLDHRVPLIAGGLHTFHNVQASHLRCNLRKGGSTQD